MGTRERSLLSLVAHVDNFPYTQEVANTYYKLYLPRDDHAHGWMHASIVADMPWTPLFHVDHDQKKVNVLPRFEGQDPAAAVCAEFANLITVAIAKDTFRCIGGRHSEPFAIPGVAYPVHLERFATSLFGITTRGAHMTAYTRTDNEMKIWVPRRSQNVGTWKGMLDSTVAGGVAANESPFENIIREAAEEASLPADLVRQKTVAAGVLTYMGISKGENGWESGMCLPDIVCVYDLQLDTNIVPKPCDDEVKDFHLLDVKDVMKKMLDGEFKPNSAVIMLDFFIRHGIVKYEDDQDFVEIVQRMHRKLPFPVHAARRC